MTVSPPHPSLITAFEQACNDAQVPTTRQAAEHTLATLTARLDSIQLALAVLHSTHSPVARFHAAASLRTALCDQWHTLPHQHRYGPTSLRHSIIDLVISNPAIRPFERLAILRTVAFLTRRAYLEEPPHLCNDYFRLICDTVSSPQSPPHAALVAVELVELILEEFFSFSSPSSSASTPSAAHNNSMDREMLVRSRAAFSSPEGHVLPLFHSAVLLNRLLTTNMPPQSYPSPSFTTRALPVLSVIHRVLTTDYKAALVISPSDPHNPADPLSGSSNNDMMETFTIYTFNSPEWHPLVIQLPLILTDALNIVAALIASPTDSTTLTDFLSNPLNIVTAIASISYAAYPTPETAREVLTAVMAGIHEHRWASSPLGPVRLAYAEVWRRVSSGYGFAYVHSLPANYITMFTTETCAQMDATSDAAVQSDEREEDVFSMDVIDLLLETWVNLALQADEGTGLAQFPLASNLEKVVIHFIRMSLRTSGPAAAGAVLSRAEALPDIEEDMGFDDASIYEARLSSAAILTRFVLAKTVDPLAQSLLQSCDKVTTWPPGQATVDGLPLDMYQEDLFFLIQLSSAVLTDQVKGELPSVPTQFLPPPVQRQVANGHSKPPAFAQRLISAMFDVAEKETRMLNERSVHCHEASPRVACAILEALTRTMGTYLVPLNDSYGAVTFEIAGGAAAVERGKNLCMSKAMEGLTQRGFESDVAEVAGLLLSSIATASKTYGELRESRVWEMLMQGGVGALQTLPPVAVQSVGKSVTTVLGDVVADRLIVPAYKCLEALGKCRGEMGDAAERAISTVNLLRGAARCDVLGERTRQALLQCLKAPDGFAAQCAKTFGDTRPDVFRVLLRLADDIVYNALPLLDGNDGRELLANVIRLIKMYVDIVKGGDGDLGADVELMLTVLTHVLDEEVEVDAGEACFYGLATVLPLMNESMLDIPSVSRTFFRFVAQLVSVHADKLSLLPPDFCGKILQSIDMQRGSFDVSSERKALEAITAVARIRVGEEKRRRRAKLDGGASASGGASGGAEGIEGGGDGHNGTVPEKSSGQEVVDRALHEFLLRIFEAITKGSAHMTNLDAAADALLPLVHVQYDDVNGRAVYAFEQVGQALVTSCGNNADLRGALMHLGQVASEAGAAYGFRPRHGNGTGNGTSNGIGDNVDGDGGVAGEAMMGAQDRAAVVQATQRFREAVAHFSQEARSCMVSSSIGTATAPTS